MITESTPALTAQSTPLVNIKVKAHDQKLTPYQETVETPKNSSLRSLKIYIIKTFPYFPSKFLFRLHNTTRPVPLEEEKKILVGTLPKHEVYIVRYIPVPPKDASAGKKFEAINSTGKSREKRNSRARAASAGASLSKQQQFQLPSASQRVEESHGNSFLYRTISNQVSLSFWYP